MVPQQQFYEKETAQGIEQEVLATSSDNFYNRNSNGPQRGSKPRKQTDKVS